MHFESYGPVRIFRPSRFVEGRVRHWAHKHLRDVFSVGTYRGAQANLVIKHQFKFYERALDQLIPGIAARETVDFLLFQYDEATRILHGNDILDLDERQRWRYVEPQFRRAIKYLVSRICLATETACATASSATPIEDLEAALICAECLVRLGHHSDTAYAIFPNDSVVDVLDGEPLDYAIRVEGTHAGYEGRFAERVERDRGSRDRFIGKRPFNFDTETHRTFLDEPFQATFGVSYGECIGAIGSVIEGSQPSLHPRSFPTLFIPYEGLVSELCRLSGRSPDAMRRVIAGFTVARDNLLTEGRAIWDPKRENRALRRGFFGFPHETGWHLAFSRSMAKECLILLVDGVCYQRLPREWDAPETKPARAKLSAKAGKWFEAMVREKLAAVGVHGKRCVGSIGEKPRRLPIPPPVGELDFLGFDSQQRCLVLVEAKMTNSGIEPRFWRDDLDQFVFGRDSYSKKFARKIAWVWESRAEILTALKLPADSGVSSAMVTLYPCIAGEFISDFECVSLAELMLDAERAAGWPYPQRSR